MSEEDDTCVWVVKELVERCEHTWNAVPFLITSSSPAGSPATSSSASASAIEL